MFEWTGGIASAALLSHGRSRAINGENPMGEKGGGLPVRWARAGKVLPVYLPLRRGK